MRLFRRISVWFRRRFVNKRHMDALPLSAVTEPLFAEYCARIFGLEVGEPQGGIMPGPFWMFNERATFKDACLFIDVRKFWKATHVAVIKGPKPSDHAFGVVFYEK